MRKKTVSQPSLFDQAIDQLMTLIEPEIELKEIDRILDENPAIIDCVHSDLVARKIKTGSKGISAEQILRSAVLKQYKRYTYRELVKRLNDGVILRWFSRFYSARIPHYTAFQKAIKHISFETWDKINDILVAFSKVKKLEKEIGKWQIHKGRYHCYRMQYHLSCRCPAFE